MYQPFGFALDCFGTPLTCFDVGIQVFAFFVSVNLKVYFLSYGRTIQIVKCWVGSVMNPATCYIRQIIVRQHELPLVANNYKQITLRKRTVSWICNSYTHLKMNFEVMSCHVLSWDNEFYSNWKNDYEIGRYCQD